jgi:hypothetical protein
VYFAVTLDVEQPFLANRLRDRIPRILRELVEIDRANAGGSVDRDEAEREALVAGHPEVGRVPVHGVVALGAGGERAAQSGGSVAGVGQLRERHCGAQRERGADEARDLHMCAAHGVCSRTVKLTWMREVTEIF